MTAVPKTSSGANSDRFTVGGQDALPPQLPALRFGLRQLFWFVAVVCMLLAALVVVEGVASLVLLLAVLVVAAHVAGTALGSRMRLHADQVRVWETAHKIDLDGCESGGDRSRRIDVERADASPSSLGRHGNALWWLWPLVVAGVAVGGGLGAVFLEWTIGPRTSAAGVVVGAVSLAVLGGWFAFLGGSFVGILRSGWRDALASERADQMRRKAVS